MRLGASRRDWSCREVRALIQWAGVVPKRELCRRLRRSGKAVERKAAWLRERGVAVDLRCHRSGLGLCPACGCRRATVGRHGICEPCRRARQLEAIEGRAAELLAGLPEAERRRYEETEAERGGRLVEPMPLRRDTRGLSRYEADRAEDEWDRAMEAWQTRRLKRLIKAAQKRKERIAKKAKTNGGFTETPARDRRTDADARAREHR